MEKVTIHRALSELKVIGQRIEKGIEAIQPSGIMQKGKLVNGLSQQEYFEKNAKTAYQSVLDLIKRRNAIKSAIVKANSETTVKIAGKTMTIADAINLKAVIGFQKKLIEVTRKKHAISKLNLEKNNAQIDAQALKLAEVALGKQGIKINDDDVEKVVGPYLAGNAFHLVDPIGIDAANEEMEKKISEFESEVDATLSEINAVTFIEF